MKSKLYTECVLAALGQSFTMIHYFEYIFHSRQTDYTDILLWIIVSESFAFRRLVHVDVSFNWSFTYKYERRKTKTTQNCMSIKHFTEMYACVCVSLFKFEIEQTL